jgi:1-acyl-sn-glycerol-3-phosphate acyltransferase
MRHGLRAAWRLARVASHVLHGLAIVALRWRALSPQMRLQRVQWWAAKLLRALDIEHLSYGAPQPGGVLVVANHVSWLDIVAIHATWPRARFVSKSEVRRWPLIGRLVDAAGTLYLERQRPRDALRVVHHCAQALRQGDTVALFPEGTTGEGRPLLPFHANLLQAAIVVGAPVQPVALRFSDARHAFSPAVVYVGETTLLQSLWWVARARGLKVHVSWLASQAGQDSERRALAAQLRQRIAQALSVDDDSTKTDPAEAKAGHAH